jgi:hypothetical protein
MALSLSWKTFNGVINFSGLVLHKTYNKILFGHMYNPSADGRKILKWILGK